MSYDSSYKWLFSEPQLVQDRLCNLFSVNFRLGGHDNRVTG
ncbi:hypothetical protein [Tepidimonas thermarum]|nr:hypothetical protein [Tepidimonas thermarum]